MSDYKYEYLQEVLVWNDEDEVPKKGFYLAGPDRLESRKDIDYQWVVLLKNGIARTFKHIKPLPVVRKRLMTTNECLGWACNEGAKGWVVRLNGGSPNPPQYFGFIYDPSLHERAPISPDGTIGEWQRFEVEVEE